MTSRRRYLRQLGAIGLATMAGCVGSDPGQIDTGLDQTGGYQPTGSPRTTGNGTGTQNGTAAGTATPGTPAVEVAVGPEGRLRFVPESVEITVGETVRWTFESPGHNVTSKPGASEKVRNPEGAEPFASYEGNQHYAIREVGATYAHPFTVPGEYVYVCEPHADQGMVGTVVVTG